MHFPGALDTPATPKTKKHKATQALLDTVTLKLSNIDRTTYQFWLTMEFAYQSIGNPFASPNKVIGNISNGALGAFCGYASAYKTLAIP